MYLNAPPSQSQQQDDDFFETMGYFESSLIRRGISVSSSRPQLIANNNANNKANNKANNNANNNNVQWRQQQRQQQAAVAVAAADAASGTLALPPPPAPAPRRPILKKGPGGHDNCRRSAPTATARGPSSASLPLQSIENNYAFNLGNAKIKNAGNCRPPLHKKMQSGKSRTVKTARAAGKLGESTVYWCNSLVHYCLPTAS